VLAAAALAGAGLVILPLIERRTPGGLLPFELFGNRPFSAALTVAGLMTFGMYALIFLLPLYFQTLLGDGAFRAGVRLLPLSVAFVLVSQRNGRIVQAIGERATMAGGMAAMGVGELLSAFGSAATSYWLVAAALCVAGVGLGLNTAAVNSVPCPARQASAPAPPPAFSTPRAWSARRSASRSSARSLPTASVRGRAPKALVLACAPRWRFGGGAELAGALVALRFIRS
jgi:hypothetical protein